MNIYDKTHFALSLLVDVSRESQLSYTCQNPASRDLDMARQFCTIKMTTSRGSGHSSAILRLTEEFKSSLIISPNKMLSDMKSKIFEENLNLKNIVNYNISGVTQVTVDSKINYFTTIDFVENFIRGSGINIEAVMVDVSNMISKNKIDKLYSLCLPFMNYSEKFFIFLQ